VHFTVANEPADDRSNADAELAMPSTAAVFRDLAPFVWRVLRRLGVREADVEDVCQEVFVTVHRKRSDFAGRSSVRTWVYGISLRVASDHRKRAYARREVLSEPAAELAIDAHQEDDLAVRQARVLLDRALDTLDDEKRAVFVLYEIEDLPMSEIAIAMDCPLQTAYSRLHAARREVGAAVERLQRERHRP
jgi:RNA polymerase sigma-70 factor (ECF subfamily)